MRSAFLLPLLTLAACATARPDDLVAPPPESGDAAATCRGDALASFAGQRRSAALATRILAATGARTIRWVEAGSMVTMEFSAERVTVYLDAGGRVERASCG